MCSIPQHKIYILDLIKYYQTCKGAGPYHDPQNGMSMLKISPLQKVRNE